MLELNLPLGNVERVADIMSNDGFLAKHAVNVKLVQLWQSSKALIQLMSLGELSKDPTLPLT